MNPSQWNQIVLECANTSIQEMDQEQIKDLAQKITDAQRVFLLGNGRTGLIAQAFGMRLAQLGLPVFLVSHPTTPALEKDDLLLLVSGSGKTESLVLAGDRARDIGAAIFLVTGEPESPLGKRIQDRLIIHFPGKSDRVLNGTLFEMALLLNLDAVVNQLLNLTGQSFEDLSARHANLG